MADNLWHDSSIFVLLRALNSLVDHAQRHNAVWMMLFEKQMDMLVEAWRLQRKAWKTFADDSEPLVKEMLDTHARMEEWQQARDAWQERFKDTLPSHRAKAQE